MEEIKNNIPQENTPEKVVDVNSPSKIQEEKEVASVTEKKVNSTKGLMTVIFLLLLAVIAMGIYILVKEGYFSEEKDTGTNEENEIVETQEEEKEIPTEIKPQLEKFEGKYISAEIPEGWAIEEFAEGKGSDSLVDGVEYTGLTAFQVSIDGSEVFLLKAIDGFGTNGCYELPHFKDSSKEYEDDNKALMVEMGETMKVLDYSNTTYSEFAMFDRTIRRVKTVLYFDEIEQNEYYEPQCESNLLYFKTTLFSHKNPSEGSTYTYKISSTATEAELNQLDEILKSMKLVK